MYSNTIYILNNTIIECFDIAFNKRRKKERKKKREKKSFVCYSRLQKEDMMVTPTCFVWGNYSYKSYSIALLDNETDFI